MKPIETEDLRETLAVLAKNKYVLATLVFLMWMLLWDDNSISARYELSEKIENMNAELRTLKGQIEQDRRKIKELQTNTESLEKFAREEYYMKKDDEVIFIVK